MINLRRCAATALGAVLLVGGLQGRSPVSAGSTPPVPCTGVGAIAAPTPSTLRYEIDLDLNTNTGGVRGRSVIRFTPDLDITELVVRLWPNGGVRDATAPSMNVGSAEVNAAVTTFSQPDPTTLVIAVPSGIASGREVKLALNWTLNVPGPRDDRVSRNSASLRYGSFLPVLPWEPGVGWNRTPPTTGPAEASMTPTADWRVSVHPSTAMQIVATGSDDGRNTWTATGTRDWAMVVGTFKYVSTPIIVGGHNVAVTVAVQQGLVDDPTAYLNRVVKALKLFSTLYGRYPWSSYTVVVTPGLKGGIEYPTLVMQGPGSIGRTTPHEVAHQWFYSLVGNDQGRDPWMDEGLASWAEMRSEGTLSTFQSKAIPADATARLGAPMTYWDAHRSSYYRGVYVQAVHALAALGPAASVDCALQHYVVANAYGVATPARLIRALTDQFPNTSTVLARYGITSA